jgi:hypothetical protein
MAVPEVFSMPWTRKRDEPRNPAVGSAPRTIYPTALEHLIEIRATRNPTERATAAGSHWALSNVAIADSVFVETHDSATSFRL